MSCSVNCSLRLIVEAIPTEGDEGVVLTAAAALATATAVPSRAILLMESSLGQRPTAEGLFTVSALARSRLSVCRPLSCRAMQGNRLQLQYTAAARAVRTTQRGQAALAFDGWMQPLLATTARHGTARSRSLAGLGFRALPTRQVALVRLGDAQPHAVVRQLAFEPECLEHREHRLVHTCTLWSTSQSAIAALPWGRRKPPYTRSPN